MKYKVLFLIASSILILGLLGFTEKKTKILIIGDSISIGYTPVVKRTLANEALVTHNEGNAQDTGYGLEKIEGWIGMDEFDIIQFNWGLWDLCYRHPDSEVYGNRDKVNGTVSITLQEYEQNLEAIVRILKEKTTAKLIFVTTSYVPEKEVGRFGKDVNRYNKVAKKVMKRHSIAVNDIYRKSKAIHKKHGQGKNDVHYEKEGYEELGKMVASFLKKVR